MEANYEYNFDKNGVPIAVTSAFGRRLSKAIPLDKMVTINEQVSLAAASFIDDCRKANKKLKKAQPTAKAEKEYAEVFLAYHLHVHQKETGERVTFVSPGKLSDTWESQQKDNKVLDETKESVSTMSEHKRLVREYDATKEGLDENDINRAFLIMACENYILTKLKQVGSRESLTCTVDELWLEAVQNVPSAQEEWEDILLSTLVQDGWILFEDKNGEVNALPYGSGVPGYDATFLSVDHPAWARDPDIEWP